MNVLDKAQFAAKHEWLLRQTESRLSLDPLSWLERHCIFPHSDRRKRFDRNFAPWFVRPLLAATSGKYREISIAGATGCGKTSFTEALIAYFLCEDPGPLQFVGPTDSDVSLWAEVRLLPMLEAIVPTRALLPRDRYDKRRMDLICPTMPIHFSGANKSSLQGKSLRYCILDETWLFSVSMIAEARARLHDRSNGVLISISQGGLDGDEHHEFHDSTEKYDYSWRCPVCRELNCYDTHDLTFTETRTTTNELDREALVRSVKMVCPKCTAPFDDTAENRQLLSVSGDYQAVPSNPFPGRIGFHVHALAIPWIPWSVIALERAEAYEKMYLGDTSAMRVFKQKREAAWWKPNDAVQRFQPTLGGYRTSDYANGELLDNEEIRAFCVDVQLTGFWVLIRAWRSDGSSRLLFADKIADWQSVLELNARYRTATTMATCDSRYDTWQVIQRCAQAGFIALQGDMRDYWQHADGLKRPYSPVEFPNASGITCKAFKYSATTVKDILQVLRQGKMLPFEVPDDIIPEYSQQLNSEIKRESVSSGGKRSWKWHLVNHTAGDHLRDTECQSVFCALIAELIRNTPETLVETVKPETL